MNKKNIIGIIAIGLALLLGGVFYITSQNEDSSETSSVTIIEKENEIVLEQSKIVGTGAVESDELVEHAKEEEVSTEEETEASEEELEDASRDSVDDSDKIITREVDGVIEFSTDGGLTWEPTNDSQEALTNGSEATTSDEEEDREQAGTYVGFETECTDDCTDDHVHDDGYNELGVATDEEDSHEEHSHE